AIGSWTDAVYLSSDSAWSPNDPVLGRVTHSVNVAGGQSYTATLAATLPGIKPGQYRVIVRTDIFREVPEAAATLANNTLASARSLTISAPELHLDTPLASTLSRQQEQLFQINVGPGQTLRVDLQTAAQDAPTELYIRYADVPSGSQYDAVYSNPMGGNQSV